MDDAPEMAPYARHVFFCTGEYCDPGRKSARLYHLFGRLLGELGHRAAFSGGMIEGAHGLT